MRKVLAKIRLEALGLLEETRTDEGHEFLYYVKMKLI